MSGSVVLRLERRVEFEGVCTLGHLVDVSDGKMVAWTLELPWRDNELNVSCFPAGVYRVMPYYSRRFKECFAFLDSETKPRTSLRVHAGNTANDTRGCVLVGGKVGLMRGQPAVSRSKASLDAMRKRYPEGFLLVAQDV